MSQHGLTLLELLIAVLISAMTMAFIVPLTTTFLKKQEAERITDELYHLCIFARAEAAYLKKPLTLCGSSTGHFCDHNWAQGALLFIDNNRNHVFDEGELPLKYSAFNLSPSILKWKGFGGKTLHIEAFGIPFASNGSFTYCSADKDRLFSKQIIVSRSGRARHSHDNNGDGIDEAIDGGDINCD
ncbi:MAG: GspH/FimT family pseudopilin [Agitococcus sp.]|nr:GspH/FimT family pseudopilin [Agitococcus sp.]